MQKLFYLSHIFTKRSMWVSFYEIQKAKYGQGVKEVRKTFSKKHKGFTLIELKKLSEALNKALLLKHKFKAKKAQKDKTNLKLICDLLYAFLEKQEGAKNASK